MTIEPIAARVAALPRKKHSHALRYGVAFGAVVAVTLLRYPLASLIGNSAPFILYFPAIVVAGWFGGSGPGLFATVLSGYCARTWFFEPTGRFDIPDWPSGFRLFLFLLSGCLTSYLCGRLHDSAAALADEKAQLEIKVRQRTQHLDRALKDMEAFSYTVSHDLRAPLRTIQGFTEIIASDHAAGLDAKAQRYLETIQKAVSQMDRLIDDLLKLAKVSETAVELGPVSLQAFVARVVDEFLRLRSPGIQISTERCTHTVVAHEVLLQQIFQNLFDNAVKYTAPGVAPVITVGSEQKGETVRLTVADNGIGIAPADQARMFRMFERIASPHDGLGIGLALVERAVGKMNGKVGVDSVVGQGSRFWIELPAAPALPAL